MGGPLMQSQGKHGIRVWLTGEAPGDAGRLGKLRRSVLAIRQRKVRLEVIRGNLQAGTGTQS